MTVVAILGIFQVIGAVTVNALIAQFIVITDGTVHDILALFEKIGIITFFIIIAFAQEVTVFEIPDTVVEVAVFERADDDCHGRVRHDVFEFGELLEEGTREIKVTSVLRGAPVVFGPFGRIPNREGLILVVL